MSQRPTYPDALRKALGVISTIGEAEAVVLRDAPGRVLAVPIVADRDLPPFDRAQMDGYALRAAEVGKVGRWPVVGTIPAGASGDIAVRPGCCVAIATGAPLPRDVDTVIQHELSDRSDPVRFTNSSIERGHAVHPRGADARSGQVVLKAGTLLGSQHIGIAASVGATSLPVVRRPRAVVLTSGDEIVEVSATPLAHQVRNSNAIMIEQLLCRIGAEHVSHQHLRDDLDETIAAVRNGLSIADLLITVGGISVGQRDHFAAAFDTCSVSTIIHGASIQPGGPIFIGKAGDATIVVGLPGNPVSALACTCLFIWPMVRAMLGLDATPPWRTMTLAEPVKPNPKRQAFRPAKLGDNETVAVPKWGGSGDLVHTAATDGLVELPVQSEPVAAGTRLRFLPWP